MKKTLQLALLCLFLNPSIVLAQGELPVNMYTGTPNIEIPIYTLTDHDLSHPVALSYNASGVRVDESHVPVGRGWSITAGGSISREVRGLPDDFAGTGTDLRRGWLYANSAADVVHNMNNASDIPNTCSEELQDFNTMNTFYAVADTEPDVFSYNLPGYSGKFVFDKDGVVRMIPLRDIKIQPIAPNGADLKITGFTLTTNDGVVYRLELPLTATRWTTQLTYPAPAAEFFKSEFELYNLNRHGAKVVYNAEWKLSKIESPSGAAILFAYTAPEVTNSADPVNVAIRKGTSTDFELREAYRTILERTRTDIYSIHGMAGYAVTFQYDVNEYTRNHFLARVNMQKTGDTFRSFDFTYKGVQVIGADYAHKFLYSITEFNECERLPPHTFAYTDINFSSETTLPEPGSKKTDFWGYYNGKDNTSSIPRLYVYPALPAAERYRLYPIPGYNGTVVMLDGADRIPDANFMTKGSLESIVFPGGGSTTLVYEPNDYYDATAGQNLPGGGLRIKSATYYNGQNPAANIVKHFTYRDDLNRSTGRLISRPSFALPVSEYRDPLDPANVKSYATLAGGSVQELWEHLTVRTEKDLSGGETTQGCVVGYKTVTVKRPGSGSAVFEFEIPGVYGEAANGAWEATRNKFSRNSVCPAMGIVTEGSAFAYPYASNPFYDYERGLLSKKTEYSEAGAKVRETTNTYQYLFKFGTAAVKVWCLQYDLYPNSATPVYFFGKYFLLTDTDKVLSSETVTVFDEHDESRSLAGMVEYFYQSGYHRLLTRTKTTNSDGTVYTSSMKYPLDYGTIPPGADKASQMIGLLQTSFRNGMPVEQVSRIKKPGELEKVVSASLTRFDDFNSNKVLPATSLSLSIPVPAATFISSRVDADTKTFVHDPAYEVIQTRLAFDEYALPLSVKGIRPGDVSSTHWGFYKTLPVATAKGARHDEFVFSDFETETGYEFNLSGSYRAPNTGRTGMYSIYPQVVLSKILKKADVGNYILSFWLKKLSSPVDFRVMLKNSTGSITYYDNTFSADPATSDFELFRKVIPVSSVPAGNFLVEFHGLVPGALPPSTPGLLPVVDDITFYPEDTEVSTFVYEMPFGVSAVTNPRGVTTYTQYDRLGRVEYILDHDKNIRQRNRYSFIGQPTWLNAVFDLPASTELGTSCTFRNTKNDCIEGESYEWNFGAGWISSGENPSITHTFMTAGTYAVQHRVSHPEYSTAIESREVTIVAEPLEVTMCARGTYTLNICTGDTTTYNCTSLTAPTKPLYTKFRAVPELDDSAPTYTYRWLRRDLNVTTWIDVGSNSKDYEWHLAAPYKSYVVKCVVTDSNGRVGETDEYAVFVSCGEYN